MRAIVLITCLVLIAPSFAFPFTQPLANPLIVMFGNSAEETEAVKTLESNLQDSIVVEFGSLDYALAKMRCIGPIIYVGHGSGDAIAGNLASADSLRINAEIKSSIASTIYLLSCNSADISDSIDSTKVKGFNQAIDAHIGAGVIAVRVLLEFGLLDKAASAFSNLLEIAQLKISGAIPFLPLYMLDPGGGGSSSGPYLSIAERNNFLAVLIIGILIAVIGTAAIAAISSKFASGASSAAAAASSSVKSATKTIITKIATAGGTSISTIITAMFGGFLAFATAFGPTVKHAFDIAKNNMNVGEWIIFTGLVIGEILAVVLTGGQALWVRIAASAGVALVNAGIIGTTDYFDSDGTPCKSVMQAISQWT